MMGNVCFCLFYFIIFVCIPVYFWLNNIIDIAVFMGLEQTSKAHVYTLFDKCLVTIKSTEVPKYFMY